MIHRLVVEVENISEILKIVKFVLELGASVNITPKIEDGKGISTKWEDDQKEN